MGIILIFLLIFVALALIALSFSEPKMAVVNTTEMSASSGYHTVKKPSFFSRVFPFTVAIMRKLKIENELQARLFLARSKFSPLEFFNIKILAALGCSVLAIMVVGKFDVMVFCIALFLAYLIPDFILNQVISKRKYNIARCLPETVDLLGLCVEAGLDFVSAVNWLIQKTSGNPLIEELAFALEEIKWGKPRIQALKDMSRRLNISDVTSFVQTLVQAERMGTPVSEAFVILSEDARLQRFHRGERQAMQAPIKILIPLIFCILPVIGIVIGGPIYLQFAQGKLF